MTGTRPAVRRLDEWVLCVVDGRERFAPQRLYETRREVECAGCGQEIAAGDRLTMHRPGGAGTRAVRLCAGCVPYRPAQGRTVGPVIGY